MTTKKKTSSKKKSKKNILVKKRSTKKKTSKKKCRRGAPIGNQFWKIRSSHGRKPIFQNPNQLWEASLEYFQWVEDNPLWEARAFSYQGEVQIESIPKMRAMTLNGLCIFLDIHHSTWNEYRKKKDFSEVIMNAERIIRDQKFTGAAADLLNPNIIARDLGLKDKHDHIHGGEGGVPVKVKFYLPDNGRG